MERLDKILVSQGIGSRKEVQKLIRSKRVTADGEVVTKPELKLDAEACSITVDGQALNVKKHIYLMLNKPQGYVSATEDNLHKTVLELVPKEFYRKGLFPAGRLDKDTEGLMIITDDGDFAHKILSPKNHVWKTYYAELDGEPDESAVERFEQGIVLDDGTKLMPAKMILLGNRRVRVKIMEGKYHQVKKMLASCGLKVTFLKRESVGGLNLDGNLPKGNCRELTNTDIDAIFLVK